MLSRVTSPASSASVIDSVPDGRSGSTRYLISAVLSHTRTSTSAGSSRPNSFNTPRGSMTARERYGADLYHTGGRPSVGHGKQEQAVHTTRLSPCGFFSTPTMYSLSPPLYPRSAMAFVAVAGSSNRFLYAASTQARATTRAPLRGPTLCS